MAVAAAASAARHITPVDALLAERLGDDGRRRDQPGAEQALRQPQQRALGGGQRGAGAGALEKVG